MTGARGAVVDGLALDGEILGNGIHGVMVDKPDYGGEGGEDAIRIERSLVRNFTGDGLHLNRIWVFSVRHSMVSANHGDGIWVQGWDGFILDTWLCANHRAGYGAYEDNASVTMTGNRIEWNVTAGVLIHGGNNYNITGSYFDRTSGPGICLLPRGKEWTQTVAATGNVFFRNGGPDERPLGENESCHARFEHVRGLTFTGNTMKVWRGDGDEGEFSPRFGIVYGHLEDSIIQGNALRDGALEQLLVDLGGHGEGVVVRDNPGSLFERRSADGAL